ncbi:MAG: tetratricopeptide repeat protein [Polyangiaceae bacterium]
MKSKVLGTASTVLFLAACGGGSSKPPAQPPPPAAPAAVASAAPASPNGPDMSGGAAGGSTNMDIVHGTKSLETGMYGDAKTSFEAALKSPHDAPDAHYYLGVVAEKQSDKATAENQYKQALKLRPDFLEAEGNLAALYVDEQKYDDALAITKAALATHPQEAGMHLNQAVALAGKGDGAGSDAEFQQALTLHQGDPMYLLTYAHWLGQWKKTDQAAEKLRAARPLAKDDVAMLASIGHEMRLVKAFSDCVPTLDRAIGLKDVAELRTDRGLCKMGAKDRPGGIADLEAAAKEDNSYAPAHFHLGIAYEKDGKIKEAIAQDETFLKLDPNAPVAAKVKEHLAKLKTQKK